MPMTPADDAEEAKCAPIIHAMSQLSEMLWDAEDETEYGLRFKPLFDIINRCRAGETAYLRMTEMIEIINAFKAALKGE